MKIVHEIKFKTLRQRQSLSLCGFLVTFSKDLLFPSSGWNDSKSVYHFNFSSTRTGIIWTEDSILFLPGLYSNRYMKVVTLSAVRTLPPLRNSSQEILLVPIFVTD